VDTKVGEMTSYVGGVGRYYSVSFFVVHVRLGWGSVFGMYCTPLLLENANFADPDGDR
jgi:hypothetical protein